MKPRTIAYVDGFNLYYGALKNTPFKWLDLPLFIRSTYPQLSIKRVKLFTARVSSTAKDPNKSTRQDVYLRALSSNNKTSIYYGQFRKRTKKGELVNPIKGYRGIVKILIWEEKGSDVNLATHLMHDAYRGAFDEAIMVSDDADLIKPVELIVKNLHLPVHALTPQAGRSSQFDGIAKSTKHVSPSILASSQFQNSFNRRGSNFTKPSAW